MKEKLLKTPQGAESIFLDEAYKHERINEVINQLYTGWGYLPIKTPVFDYYETYENLLSKESKKNCFRLMDRDGELLLLRNDITLFMAKQLGRVIKSDEGSLRVHYADSILRHQSEIDISSNEFFQTGAELVGCPSIHGDLEIITLLHTIIEELKLNTTRIHIGSRTILDGVIKKYSDLESETLIELINSRDRERLITYFGSVSDASIAEELTNLFMFIGTFTEFKTYIEGNNKIISALGINDAISYLVEIGSSLEEVGIINSIRFDLSEVANRAYYTGIVFKAYTDGVDSAIASGGRYDNLIKSFGKDIPSVGFSILLRKIEKKVDDERFNPPVIIELEGDFSSTYKEAAALRKSGKTVIIRGGKN